MCTKLYQSDTLEYVPEPFWRAAVAGPGPMLMQPEEGGNSQSLYYTKAGWAYWTQNDVCKFFIWFQTQIFSVFLKYFIKGANQTNLTN